MSENNRSDSSLRYFTVAETDLRERRFAEALFTLEDGLRTSYHSSQPIDSKTLIRHLFSFIGLLKLNLEQSFGEKWQEEVLKRMPSQHVAALEMCCSFCGQPKDSVSNLIAGPAVNICNQCVDICVEIVADAQSTS
jgi:hypothetical protein